MGNVSSLLRDITTDIGRTAMTVKDGCRLNTNTQSSNWAFPVLLGQGFNVSLDYGARVLWNLVYVEFVSDKDVKHALKACFMPSHLA